MGQNEKTKIFKGKIDGIEYIFHAENNVEDKIIHLVIFNTDDPTFNSKDEPCYRIIMKDEMPAKYELQRAVGLPALTKIELTRIVHETLSKFGEK